MIKKMYDMLFSNDNTFFNVKYIGNVYFINFISSILLILKWLDNKKEIKKCKFVIGNDQWTVSLASGDRGVGLVH